MFSYQTAVHAEVQARLGYHHTYVLIPHTTSKRETCLAVTSIHCSSSVGRWLGGGIIQSTAAAFLSMSGVLYCLRIIFQAAEQVVLNLRVRKEVHIGLSIDGSNNELFSLPIE